MGSWYSNNQRKMMKSKRCEIQMGGVIYSDSADKAARFIMNCNQKRFLSFSSRRNRFYDRVALNMVELLKMEPN